MAEISLNTTILLRRDSAADWSTHNPVLKDGEIVYDSTNKRVKIGDGTNAWSNLGYAFPNIDLYKDSGIEGTSNFYIKSDSSKVYFNGSYLYPDKNTYHLGSPDYKWGKVYSEEVNTGNIQTTGKLFTNESSFSIEVSSSGAGLTIDNDNILPNRNGTSSIQGISLGSLDKRFNIGYFNELNLKAVSENYYVTISQMYNSPSDHGLQVKGSYNSSNALQICPDSGWIGKNHGSAGSIYFKTTGIGLGSNYSGCQIELKLDTSAKGEMFPKANGGYPNQFAIGKREYPFSSGHISNLILNPNGISEESEISYNVSNIINVDSLIYLKRLKSFKITGIDTTNKTFTLDSVTGLEVGDVYSTACAGTLYNNYGTITAINGNVVTVSAIPSISYYAAEPAIDHMSFRIRSKPDVGSKYLTGFTEVANNNLLMIEDVKLSNVNSSEGQNILNRNNAFAFGKGLTIPVTYSSTSNPFFKIGKYDNDNYGSYPFLIGWGTSDTDRKNIFYITSSGGVYAGSIYPNSSASSTNDLGASGSQWDNGYINTVYLNNSWATLPTSTNQHALGYKNYGNTSVGDIDAITTPGLYTLRQGITGGPYCSNTGSGGAVASSFFTVLCMATDNGSGFRPMIGIKESDNNLYVKGSTAGSWKRIGWGYGTSAPSGTANTGDIYIQYEA